MKSTLYIDIQGREGVVRYGKKSGKVQLGDKPFVSTISTVVGSLLDIKSIVVTMKETTFSGTRQVIATVNTICWALGIKVNGKKQMSAKYDREPNITMPKGSKGV